MIDQNTEPKVKVDLDARAVDEDSLNEFITVREDTGAETIYFYCSPIFDGVNLYDKIQNNEISLTIYFLNGNEEGYTYIVDRTKVTMESIEEEDMMQFAWTLNENATQYAGNLIFSIKFISNDDSTSSSYVGATYKLNIKNAVIPINDTITLTSGTATYNLSDVMSTLIYGCNTITASQNGDNIVIRVINLYDNSTKYTITYNNSTHIMSLS